MRPMPRVLIGVTVLCALLSVTACSSSGTKPDSYQPIKERIVEAKVRQLVPIDRTLTQKDRLPAAPTPAVSYGEAGCLRPAGCFSNKQVDTMLSQALDGYGKRGDNLDAIRRASDDATNPKEPSQ